MDLIAVTCVLASDGVLRQPGDVWACPDDDADELLAAGAAVRAEPSTDIPGTTETRPGDAAPGDPDPAAVLTRLSGIGPATAQALVAAGVPDLTVLAALSDDRIAALELDQSVRTKIRDDWRGQAQTLLAAAESRP